MIKFLDIRGTAVINGKGEAEGSVLDCIFDKKCGRITSLIIINRTPLSRFYLLRFNDIKSIGNNLITDKTLHPVKKGCLLRNKDILFSNYIDREVIDDKGNNLGEIKDAIIENETGIIKAIICTRGFIEDMMEGRRVFLVDGDTIFGRDRIIINNCTINIYNEMSIWRGTKG